MLSIKSDLLRLSCPFIDASESDEAIEALLCQPSAYRNQILSWISSKLKHENAEISNENVLQSLGLPDAKRFAAMKPCEQLPFWKFLLRIDILHADMNMKLALKINEKIASSGCNRIWKASEPLNLIPRDIEKNVLGVATSEVASLDVLQEIHQELEREIIHSKQDVERNVDSSISEDITKMTDKIDFLNELYRTDMKSWVEYSVSHTEKHTALRLADLSELKLKTDSLVHHCAKNSKIHESIKASKKALKDAEYMQGKLSKIPPNF